MCRLLTSFLLIAMTISASQSQTIANKQTVRAPFETHSPQCVVSALYQCEYFGAPDSHIITELKTIMRNLKCQPNQSFIDLSANLKASMEEISKLLLNMSEHQDLIIKIANSSSTTENLIQNEIKEIRNELISLKESNEQNTAKEEIKSFIKALKFYVLKRPTNCADVSHTDNGTKVYPFDEYLLKYVVVLCDQTTDGGGWTVIQNRDALPVRVNFERGWNDHVEGFGDLNGEFWLGLDNIHVLTSSTPMELRVDLEDFDGVKKWAKYDLFRIGDESTKYVLTLGNYSGDAGDSLTYHNGMKFSTYDQDNDNAAGNCAKIRRGGWWYNVCHNSNLNGYQYVGKYDSGGDGIFWRDFRGWNYSYKKASMKIRPQSFN